MIGSFGSNLFWNIFSLYVYDELHASLFEVGLVFMIGQIASALLMMPVGYVADKIGKKKVVVVGCYVLSFATLLYAFTRSWMELMPVLFLFSAAWSYRPVMSALIADSVVKKKRAMGFAMFDILPGITIIFASGLGGFLSETLGFRPLFMLATVLLLTMTVMRHLFLREPKDSSETSSSTFKSPIEGLSYIRKASTSLKAFFIMTCLGSFFGSFVFPQYYALYAQKTLHLSRTQIGLSFAISQTFMTLLIVPAGKLADHYGRKRFLVLSGITSPLSLTFYLFAPNVLVVYLTSTVSGTMQGLSAPSWQAIQADLIPRGKRGTIMGLFAATRNTASIPSPTIGGYLWETYEPKAPFYVLISSQVITLSILLLFIKETLPRKKIEAETTMKTIEN